MLSVTANQHKVDLLLVSEPSQRMREGIHYNNRGDAAIIVTDKRKRPKRTGKSDGFVWIEKKKTAYYNVYFSPKRRIDNFEDLLTNIGLTIRTQDHK